MTELIFATQNQNKVEEVKAVLPTGIRLLSLADLGFHEELQEDFDTLEQNAMQKARFVFERFNKPCFAEDAGLEVASLGGAPGVKSARYAGSAKSSQENIALLLNNLSGTENRDARFRAVIAYCDDHQGVSFDGTCEGKIALQPVGTNGFGYDPVFIPKGYNETFGQLQSAIKHKISHRTKAMNLFISFLERSTTSST